MFLCFVSYFLIFFRIRSWLKNSKFTYQVDGFNSSELQLFLELAKSLTFCSNKLHIFKTQRKQKINLTDILFPLIFYCNYGIFFRKAIEKLKPTMSYLCSDPLIASSLCSIWIFVHFIGAFWKCCIYSKSVFFTTFIFFELCTILLDLVLVAELALCTRFFFLSNTCHPSIFYIFFLFVFSVFPLLLLYDGVVCVLWKLVGLFFFNRKWKFCFSCDFFLHSTVNKSCTFFALLRWLSI